MSLTANNISNFISASQQQLNGLIKEINNSNKDDLNYETLSKRLTGLSLSNQQLVQLYLAAIHKNWKVFKDLPAFYKTKEFCLEALNVNSSIYLFIPEELKKDYDVLYEIIKKEGFSLECVPVNMRDLKMCAIAVENNMMNVTYVPEEFLSNSIFSQPLKKAYEAAENGYINILPVSRRTLSICLRAVSVNMQNIQHVPSLFYDHEDFQLAIQSWQDDIIKNPEKLKYSAVKLVNQYVCNKILESSSKYYPDIPVKFRNYELCLSILESKCEFKYFYVKNLLKDMKNNPESFDMDGQVFIKFYKQYLKNCNDSVLDLIPKDYLTYELFYGVIKENPKALGFLENYEETTLLSSDKFLALCKKAVSEKAWSINYIPKSYLTMGLYTSLINLNPRILEFINPCQNEKINENNYMDLCMLGVKKSGDVLSMVPEDSRSFALCLESVRSSKNGLTIIFNSENTFEDGQYACFVRLLLTLLEWPLKMSLVTIETILYTYAL